MKVFLTVPCLALGLALGCAGSNKSRNERIAGQLIQAQINEGIAATRAQDIDRYMRVIPPDWLLHDETGHVVTRDDLRHSGLQQWAIIQRTISLSESIDRLDVGQNAATVWTSQRWERLMHQRTGPLLDDVLTTERHEEHWRFVSGKWWCYDVKELGGEIYVNGKPYKE